MESDIETQNQILSTKLTKLIYRNLFLTKKQTDYAWHLILARVEKAAVIPDNTVPKSYLPLFVENYYWALSTNSGTRLLRQEKKASRKV